MLSINNLTYRIGARTLIEESSVNIMDGWKVGLVGANGTGKSTLFKLISGELQADMGRINLGPIRSALLQIHHAKAADIAAVLQDKNAALLSARGRLAVDTRSNTIWVRDNRAQIEEIRKLVRQFDIPVKQVLIILYR